MIIKLMEQDTRKLTQSNVLTRCHMARRYLSWERRTSRVYFVGTVNPRVAEEVDEEDA